jgi:hypothetical protein
MNWRMNGMGQNRHLLNTVLLSEMKDGTPLYEYTWDLLQHFDGDYAAAAQGIRKFMGEKAGSNWGQFVREVQEAGRDIDDPVLHTMEMLLSEGATPHKNTMRDIKQAEAPIETTLIAPKGEPPEMDLETALNQRQMEITPDESDFEEMNPPGYTPYEPLKSPAEMGSPPAGFEQFLWEMGGGAIGEAANATENWLQNTGRFIADKLRSASDDKKKNAKNPKPAIMYPKPWEK